MSSMRCRIIALAATLVFGTAESIWAAPDSYPNDAVLEWNQIALDATVKAGQGPVPQIRTMAIVHVSVHDAVNAIAGDYKTYLRIQAEPAGASPEAAAIAAAHRALAGLFPLQAPDLGPLRAASLAAHGLTEDDPGVAFGDAVAAFILALRASDGAAQAQLPYTAPGAGQPGVWVPIGPADDSRLASLAPAITPGWGKITPWVLKNGSQFRPSGPPPTGSRRLRAITTR
jgi:hypothetical protein